MDDTLISFPIAPSSSSKSHNHFEEEFDAVMGQCHSEKKNKHALLIARRSMFSGSQGDARFWKTFRNLKSLFHTKITGLIIKTVEALEIDSQEIGLHLAQVVRKLGQMESRCHLSLRFAEHLKHLVRKTALSVELILGFWQQVGTLIALIPEDEDFETLVGRTVDLLIDVIKLCFLIPREFETPRSPEGFAHAVAAAMLNPID